MVQKWDKVGFTSKGSWLNPQLRQENYIYCTLSRKVLWPKQH